MAYAAISFSALEQPTLAKWNILGTNDAYFNTQIGANFSSGTTSTVWWEELGRTTLGGAGDTISVASFAARKYLKVQFVFIPSGALNSAIRFNNDSGANYSYRYETDGSGSNAVAGANNGIVEATGGAFNCYGEIDILNISSIAKVSRCAPATFSNTAASAPSNSFIWNKWANTSTQITRIDLLNVGAGDFAAGSSLIVLGHD